jgi:hypothetical protein
VLGQLAQQQELQPGQRDWTGPDVGHQAPDVQGEAARPDHLPGPFVPGQRTGQRIRAAQPDPDPGQQLGQRERLGQVVLCAALQAVHLGRHVGQAGQHEHGLVGARGQHALEDGLARHAGHDQIQDDQVVMAGLGAAQRLGAGGREVGQVTRRVQRPADERADARLVVGHQDPGGDGVCRLGEGGLGRFLGSHRLFVGRLPLACPPRHQARAPIRADPVLNHRSMT